MVVLVELVEDAVVELEVVEAVELEREPPLPVGKNVSPANTITAAQARAMPMPANVLLLLNAMGWCWGPW